MPAGDDFKAATNTVKTCFVLSIVGIIFSLTSVCASYWYVLSEFHYGLWSMCIASHCNSFDFPQTNWLGIIQFLAVVGTVLILVGLIMLSLYIFGSKKGSMETLAQCCYVFFVAALLWGACLFVYDCREHRGNGFAYWLGVLAGILAFVISLLLHLQQRGCMDC